MGSSSPNFGMNIKKSLKPPPRVSFFRSFCWDKSPPPVRLSVHLDGVVTAKGVTVEALRSRSNGGTVSVLKEKNGPKNKAGTLGLFASPTSLRVGWVLRGEIYSPNTSMNQSTIFESFERLFPNVVRPR